MVIRSKSPFLVAVTILSVVLYIMSWSHASASEEENKFGVKAQVENTVREYFDALKRYDFERMRGLSTPGFEAILAGFRMDYEMFEGVLRAETEKEGPIETHPQRLDYLLDNFDIQIDGDVAYSADYERTAQGLYCHDFWVLHRVGPREWKVHRMLHQPNHY